jgi:uncharacterized protein (DUF1800 family)
VKVEVCLRSALALFLAVSAFAFSRFDFPPAAHAAAMMQSTTPSISWMSPYPAPLGAFTLNVYGSNFQNGAVVKWAGTPLPTTFVSSSQVRATGTATQSGSVFITVTNPGASGATSSQRLLEVGQGIVVTITPSSATVAPGATKQFAATVTGAANTGVWWYVNNTSTGNSTIGTITQNGLYKAPAIAPSTPITIRAVAQANSEHQASAAVTISGAPAGVTVAISPTSASVQTGTTRQFTASVTGSANTAVIWRVSDIVGGNSTVGTISSSGLYTTPNVAPANPVAVSATSQADSTKRATALVTVTSAPATVAVTINPTSATVNTGATRQFTATVTGSANTAVTWRVNNVTGGNSTVGTITNSGLYTAPSAVPAGAVTVSAVSQADTTRSASANISITAPPVAIAVSVSPATANLTTGATQQFTATVTGTANTAVIWRVNSINGGNATVGTITNSGLYTAPGAIPVGSITVSAVSQADNTKQATASVTVLDTQLATYGRFLDQATFGPTPQLIAQAQQTGMQGFLNQQFALPESSLPVPISATMNGLTDAFFANALGGQDQLRQRVIFALSEVIVVARNKNYNADMLAPWLRLLSRNAFGNYKTLLRELSNDSSMGQFLDLANSGVSGGANENYPRELLQLFSIGLYKLNPDGSQQLDANGQPIPTYTQSDVQQLALALTGWTYDNANHTTPGSQGNPNYFAGPLVAIPGRHNTSAKTFLGQTLPAGQSAQQDLDGASNIIFNHPNVGPFLATRMIRAMVTSNPSPGYIARTTAAFNDNGQGVRGDMKAVITAILMDQEARNDNPPASFGRLRTPLQSLLFMARALSYPVGTGSSFNYQLVNMGEEMLNAPSVFGHYSPMFRIPKGNGLFGPEFQIYTATEAANRGNFLWGFLNNTYPINPALQPLVNIAASPATLVSTVDNLLLYGRMSTTTRQALFNALPQMYDDRQRVFTALYLVLTSGEFLVQR